MGWKRNRGAKDGFRILGLSKPEGGDQGGTEAGVERICRGEQGLRYDMLSWGVCQTPQQNVLPDTA